jgi:hypothetical protein
LRAISDNAMRPSILTAKPVGLSCFFYLKTNILA